MRLGAGIEGTVEQVTYLADLGEDIVVQPDRIVLDVKIVDRIDIGRTKLGTEHERVLARAADQQVLAEAAVKLVVTGTAGKLVGRSVADQGIGIA